MNYNLCYLPSATFHLIFCFPIIKYSLPKSSCLHTFSLYFKLRLAQILNYLQWEIQYFWKFLKTLLFSRRTISCFQKILDIFPVFCHIWTCTLFHMFICMTSDKFFSHLISSRLHMYKLYRGRELYYGWYNKNM